MGRREIRSWLMDMDGVLVREEQVIPGADRLVERLRETGTPFLVLTNNSIYRAVTWRRACACGASRSPRGASGPRHGDGAVPRGPAARGVGLRDRRAGLTAALPAGYTLTEHSPDYVVLGETRSFWLRAHRAAPSS